MIPSENKRNIIFSEMVEEEQKKWFDFTKEKVIHEIDTLYVTMKVSGEYDTSGLVAWLEDMRKKVELEPVLLEDLGLYVTNMSFVNYKYCLEKKDGYMIFFVRKSGNENVPQIFVQIRSQYLWTNNIYSILKEIFEMVESIVIPYGLHVFNVKENRIDFAYHSNYIRNMSKFFDKVNPMQVSHFRRGSKEFTFTGDEEEDVDYISLGRRKSNNVFVRIYNKTKEVVEQGYKQFFLEYWYQNKLINAYDKLIYEQCFIKKNYEYAVYARLNFYITYGKDATLKQQAIEYVAKYELSNPYDYDIVLKFANKLTPVPTLIVNLEFQTKRKFYATFDKECFGYLQSVTKAPCDPLTYIYKLLDNKKLIHNLLTEDVLRLVDVTDNKSRKRDKRNHPFWDLIQNCNIAPTGVDGKILRQYQRNLDVAAIKNRLVSSISTFSLYLNGDNENDVFKDGLDFMCYLNETDIEKAQKIKIKKAPTLENKLKTTVDVGIDSRFMLLDKEYGTYID